MTHTHRGGNVPLSTHSHHTHVAHLPWSDDFWNLEQVVSNIISLHCGCTRSVCWHCSRSLTLLQFTGFQTCLCVCASIWLWSVRCKVGGICVYVCKGVDWMSSAVQRWLGCAFTDTFLGLTGQTELQQQQSSVAGNVQFVFTLFNIHCAAVYCETVVRTYDIYVWVCVSRCERRSVV